MTIVQGNCSIADIVAEARQRTKYGTDDSKLVKILKEEGVQTGADFFGLQKDTVIGWANRQKIKEAGLSLSTMSTTPVLSKIKYTSRYSGLIIKMLEE